MAKITDYTDGGAPQNGDYFIIARSPYSAGTNRKIEYDNFVLSESQVTGLTADLASKLNLNGGTLTGPLVLSSNATTPLEPVALQQLAAYLQLGGGTMTGNLILNGNASTSLQAVPLQQLNAALPTLPLTVPNGGTGITSYTIGDIPYASGTTTLSKLADVATGNVISSGGVGVAPFWGKVGLTTHVSGILSSANGGTGVNNGTQTINLTTFATDYVLTCDASGNVTPQPNGGSGGTYLRLSGGTMTGAIVLSGNAISSLNPVSLQQLNAFVYIGTITNITNSDSPYTVLSSDQYLSVDVSLGAVTILLPNSTTNSRTIAVKNSGGNASANNITVTTVGGVVNLDRSPTSIINIDDGTAIYKYNLSKTKYEIN